MKRPSRLSLLERSIHARIGAYREEMAARTQLDALDYADRAAVALMRSKILELEWVLRECKTSANENPSR